MPHAYYSLTQVARTMAPSVIYMDDAEKVFLSDKKKLKEFGSQARVFNFNFCCGADACELGSVASFKPRELFRREGTLSEIHKA